MTFQAYSEFNKISCIKRAALLSTHALDTLDELWDDPLQIQNFSDLERINILYNNPNAWSHLHKTKSLSLIERLIILHQFKQIHSKLYQKIKHLEAFECHSDLINICKTASQYPEGLLSIVATQPSALSTALTLLHGWGPFTAAIQNRHVALYTALPDTILKDELFQATCANAHDFEYAKNLINTLKARHIGLCDNAAEYICYKHHEGLPYLLDTISPVLYKKLITEDDTSCQPPTSTSKYWLHFPRKGCCNAIQADIAAQYNPLIYLESLKNHQGHRPHVMLGSTFENLFKPKSNVLTALNTLPEWLNENDHRIERVATKLATDDWFPKMLMHYTPELYVFWTIATTLYGDIQPRNPQHNVAIIKSWISTYYQQCTTVLYTLPLGSV